MKILLFIRSYSSHTRIVPYGIQRTNIRNNIKKQSFVSIKIKISPIFM